jgi:FtsH-binding integral membrane protein
VTTTDTPAGDPTRSLRATFRGIGSVVAPTSALTALLYYFGWTRTSVEATQLGLDDSLLGYSTRDYLLRSMSSMLAPLVVGLVATLAALGFHTLVMAWARRQTPVGEDPPAEPAARRLLGRVTVGLAAAGLLSLALGVAGTRVRKPSHELYVASPVCVTVGIVLVVYAVHLYRRFFVTRDPAPTTGPFEGFSVIVTSTIVTLLLLSMFWNVSHYALVKGRTLAATVEAAVPRQPGVIVYSEKRLYLQAPVVETRLEPENAAYNYAYTGLKLLFHANGKYFLRPSDPSSSVNILIPDGLDIRLELFKS